GEMPQPDDQPAARTPALTVCDFSPHSPCSVVPVSQLALPCCRLTRLTWFRDKRQRGRGSRTAQAAGPLAADDGHRDTETKRKELSRVRVRFSSAIRVPRQTSTVHWSPRKTATRNRRERSWRSQARIRS